MSTRSFVIAFVWAVSLIVVGLVGRAQVIPAPLQPVTPRVVTTDNIGFLVESRRGGTPVGKLVIRKDDKSAWTPVEVLLKPDGVRPLE